MNQMRTDDLSSISQSTETLIQEESDLFLKHNPLINLILLSIGPILTTIGLSVLDSVDLMIISQRFKNDPDSYAVQIIGVALFVLQLCLDIGMFLAQAIMVRVSSLIGSGQRNEACQLTVDIFRISFVVTIFATILFTFVSRPIMTFSGCPEELIEQAYLLIISNISGLPIYTFFHITTGFLQAIGRTVLNGVLHFAANLLQTFIITPLLQFGLKIDVTLSNISQPIAQSVIGLTLFVMIFRGKFSLKPSFRMWFAPFSRETRTAIVMSLPMIPTLLFTLLSSTIILRFMTLACETDKMRTDIIAIYTIIQKIILICVAVPIALTGGYITAATHSVSIGNYSRMLKTYFWVFFISMAFSVILCPFLIFKPLVLVKLFTNVDSQLDLSKKLVPIPIYTIPLCLISSSFSPFFVSIGKSVYALIVPIIQLVSPIIGAKILFSIYPKDPTKILYSYNICDITTFIVSLPMFLISIIPIIKKARASSEKEIQSIMSFRLD